MHFSNSHSKTWWRPVSEFAHFGGKPHDDLEMRGAELDNDDAVAPPPVVGNWKRGSVQLQKSLQKDLSPDFDLDSHF